LLRGAPFCDRPCLCLGSPLCSWQNWASLCGVINMHQYHASKLPMLRCALPFVRHHVILRIFLIGTDYAFGPLWLRLVAELCFPTWFNKTQQQNTWNLPALPIPFLLYGMGLQHVVLPIFCWSRLRRGVTSAAPCGRTPLCYATQH